MDVTGQAFLLTPLSLPSDTVPLLSQEAEALEDEMDVTGQAFEEMQDQNIRLIQQLREKDDANFKLMSERIKANQTHNLVLEEKNMMSERVSHTGRRLHSQPAVRHIN